MTKHFFWIVPLVILGAVGAYVWYGGKAPVPPPPPTPSLPQSTTPPPTLTYYCDGNKTMKATFKQSSVSLSLSDGRAFDLPQVMSGSGIRYEATTSSGQDTALVGKGDQAYLSEGSHTTFANCVAAWVEASDAPGYETFTDNSRTFTFALPTDFAISGSAIGLAPGWSEGEQTNGMVLVKLTVPQSFAPSTNFVGATFTVGDSSDPAAVADCTKGPQGAVATPTKLGDMAVTMLAWQGRGAGQIYDTTSYRVLQGGVCYAIEYTIHSSDIANFPKGTKAFDKQSVVAALDEVAKSFQFLQH